MYQAPGKAAGVAVRIAAGRRGMRRSGDGRAGRWLSARTVLAGLLGAMALGQASDLDGFEAALAGYRVVPDAVLGPAARLLVGVEAVAAVALVRRWRGGEVLALAAAVAWSTAGVEAFAPGPVAPELRMLRDPAPTAAPMVGPRRGRRVPRPRRLGPRPGPPARRGPGPGGGLNRRWGTDRNDGEGPARTWTPPETTPPSAETGRRSTSSTPRASAPSARTWSTGR